jgi:hypothetical protein
MRQKMQKMQKMGKTSFESTSPNDYNPAFNWSDNEGAGERENTGVHVDREDRGVQGADYPEGRPNHYNLLGDENSPENQNHDLDTHSDPKIAQMRHNLTILRRSRRDLGVLETPSLGALVKMVKHRVLEINENDLNLLDRVPELQIALKMNKLLSQCNGDEFRLGQVFEMIEDYDRERGKIIKMEIKNRTKNQNWGHLDIFSSSPGSSTSSFQSQYKTNSIYDAVNRSGQGKGGKMGQKGYEEPIDPLFDQDFVPNLNDLPSLFESSLGGGEGVGLHSIRAVVRNFGTLLSRGDDASTALHDVTRLYLFLLGLEQSLLKSTIEKMKGVEGDQKEQQQHEQQHETRTHKNTTTTTFPTTPFTLSPLQSNAIALYKQTNANITPVHFQTIVLKTLVANFLEKNENSQNQSQNGPNSPNSQNSNQNDQNLIQNGLDKDVTKKIELEFIKLGLMRGQYPSFSIGSGVPIDHNDQNGENFPQNGQNSFQNGQNNQQSPQSKFPNTAIISSVSHAQITTPQHALYIDLHGVDFRLQPHVVTHQFEQLYQTYALQRLKQLQDQVRGYYGEGGMSQQHTSSPSSQQSTQQPSQQPSSLSIHTLFQKPPTIQSLRSFDDSKLKMPDSNNDNNTNNTNNTPGNTTTPSQPIPTSNSPNNPSQSSSKIGVGYNKALEY